MKATYKYVTRQHATCAVALGAVDKPVLKLDKYLCTFAAV